MGVFLCSFGPFVLKKLHRAKKDTDALEYSGVSAECCRHAGLDNNECARSIHFGMGPTAISEDDAVERLKKLLVIGYSIPECDKDAHMANSLRPRGLVAPLTVEQWQVAADHTDFQPYLADLSDLLPAP